MYDIFFIGTSLNNTEYKKLKEKYPTIKSVKTFFEAKEKSLTKFFWAVWDDLIISQDFCFDYCPDQWSSEYIHLFKNGKDFDGIALVPKNIYISKKEVDYRFFTSKKEINIVASSPRTFDLFFVDNYEDYKTALENSTTEMFWVSSKNISHKDSLINNFYITHHDVQLRSQTHAFIHKVDGNNLYNGLFLCSKRRELSAKEVEYRFPVNRIEHTTVGSTKKYYDVFEIDSYEEYVSALENSTTEMFWMSSKNISATIPKIYFTHDNDYDRKQNHAFVHKVKDKALYNGLFLCSKHKPLAKREVEYRHPVDRKEWNVIGSRAKKYDQFEISTYEEYVSALENSTTEMFWCVKPGVNVDTNIFKIYFTHDNEYDRKQNHSFIHKSKSDTLRNSVWLLSKKSPISKKEIDYRFLVNSKEWDVVASKDKPYDIFKIDNFEDYQTALKSSTTEMFWAISSHANITDSKIFKTIYPYKNAYDKEFEFDRTNNHTYLHKIGEKIYKNSVWLLSKNKPLSKREVDYRFIINAKEHEQVASVPVNYDVVFISYQEPNADENYERLLTKIPTAKRVHGVKGIHQAHIAAAKLCATPMFWIVDGDATIVDEFNFNYELHPNEYDHVLVWRSKNPINDLVYGYGGVKLFPTTATINMDLSKPDMTTSITNKFKAVTDVSNITAFNTDPFNTWRSAFRECCKLSSKIIDRQKEDETNNRLQTWCTIGADRPLGQYAIDGAKAGASYGARNKDNIEMLKKINDFSWLKEQFDAANI